MTTTNSTLLLTVLAAACLLGTVSAGNYPEKEGRHNITWGTKGPRDVLLYNDEPTLSGKILQKQSYDVCYPSKDSVDHVRISHYNVEAVNNQGLAYLNKDPAFKTDDHRVCFHLKTPRSEGYHFKVQVWGTKILTSVTVNKLTKPSLSTT